MNFEDYLRSKKIDSEAFRKSEPEVWTEWAKEFEHLSAASFTAQKLYLINPVRRKYILKEELITKNESPTEVVMTIKAEPNNSANSESAKPGSPKPVIARPVVRPKPKMN